MHYKLIVYVPEVNLKSLKNELFAAGAGSMGNYEHCAWQVKGLGQFKPMAGSQPHLGKQGELEEVEEWRLELLVPEDKAANVKAALLRAHPYEEPAYEFIACAQVE